MPRQMNQTDLSGTEIEDWDFASADTGEFTHTIHPYPARMVPQIANRLIRRFSSMGDKVFDPFSGSGTVLLEGARLGRMCYGSDINPLAVLISNVKCTPLDDAKIEKLADKVIDQVEIERSSPLRSGIPEVAKLDYWFKETVIRNLALVGLAIRRVNMNDDYRGFFRLCMSATIYDTANLDKRDNPYFLRTLKGTRLEEFKPDAMRTFREKISSMRSKLRDLSRLLDEHEVDYHKPKVFLGDSRDLVDKIGGFDLLVTSPPYGEEKNTMSYMRFAKLACHWLGYSPEDLKSLESHSLGSNPKTHESWQPPSDELQHLLEHLRSEEKTKRALEVAAFFGDYHNLLSKAVKSLTDGGHFCIVIGNRTANGAPVRNDLVTQQLCESLGLVHMETYYRNIPKKVLPRSDGKVSLINAESIVVMAKC